MAPGEVGWVGDGIMGPMVEPGWVVILNGAPRSGKSSIATALQATPGATWVNLGVDAFARTTPPELRPGIGLRPSGERPDLEAEIPALYESLYGAVAAASRQGLNVVVDVGMHDGYSRPLGVWRLAAAQLDGLPVLVVGVRCPVAVILQRRAAATAGDGEGQYLTGRDDGTVPEPVRRWEEEVHRLGIYDLEVDTSTATPAECAARITARLLGPPPTALSRLG